MALKVLMLQKRKREKQEELFQLREAAKELKTRELELEQAIVEASTEEEKQVVEETVSEFESAKESNSTEQGRLSREIEEIEQQIANLEKNSPEQLPALAEERNERKEIITMEKRTKFFGMSHQERTNFFAQEAVKDFLANVRSLGKEKRSVSGSELLIPEVVLELVKENITDYSKLLLKVNKKPVTGTARQNIMGTIPEAIWTEMCGKLNELEFTFNNVEVDGYKVAGYVPICNALLKDSDINLAQEIITGLGQAVGYALDKAILYGKGIKMPLGIVTRLAQETKPSDYPATSREWKDLHTTNLKTITGKSGIELYKELVMVSGAAKGKYSKGKKFWVMNETTYTTLMAEALSINAAGAVVTGMNQTMPAVGGDILFLDFIPDGDIIGGYGDLYLLAEREGIAMSQSEHIRFLEDQTVFKATARYDGVPVIPEGFVAVNINGETVTTSMTFAEDKANVDSNP